MFAQKTTLQPEMNPIDLLRKYAPYLIGAGAAVGTIVALYYYAYDQAEDLTQQGFDAADQAMSHNSELSTESSDQAAIDSGLVGGATATVAAW